MVTRTEKVVLTADVGGFTSAMARASASTTLLNRELADLDGSSVRTKKSMRDAEQGVTSFGKSAQRSSADLDTFSGRLGLLGTAAAALGPSLVPVLGAAVPAIGALSTGMVGATAAAGTLLLAFQGVGDAVSAVSDYQLEPTADNLAKVKAAFDELGPSGTRFVMALKEMQPVLDDLQQASRDGIFPGFERGLDELVSKAPQIISFVEDISTRLGDLGGDLGSALANDADMQEFFAFIQREAGPAMEDFGRATGNFIAGIANMVEAISGLSGGVSGDLLDMSRSFREWAAGMEDTDGFREFADYIRTTGPQVADFLGALGEALVALTTAVAPWGAVVLPVLTAAAKVFTALAESPIGPPLFAAAAAMLAFNKASALLGPSLAKTSTSVRGLGADLRLLSTAATTYSWERTAAQATAFGAAAERTRGRVSALARGVATAGPGIAAFGFMASGAADKVGLSNTAMLTMAGSMAGPWGTAIGAGVGLTMDLAHANDDLASAIEGANAAMDSGSLQDMTARLKTLRGALKETNNSKDLGFEFGSPFGAVGGLANAVLPGVSLKKVMADLTGDTDKAKVAIQELAAEKGALEDLSVALGANRSSATEMATGAARAQDAMDALGISSEDLAAAQRMGGVEFDLLTGRIRDYIASSDTISGRTEAVGDAIADLSNDALSAADSASALSAALDALISPEQNLIGAQDALTKSIRHLGDDLDKQNKTLEGNSDAAIKNRAAISGRVDDLKAMIAAEAEAGRGPEVVANSLGKQRKALIDSAVAAGANRKEVERLVNQMNLTPELVKTVFENAGIDQSEQKARDLADRYKALPKKLRSEVGLEGVLKADADISELTKKYHLTPRQVKTLASLKDSASKPIEALIRKILGIPDKRVKVSANDQASGVLARVKGIMDSLHDKSVTFTTVYHQVNTQSKVERQLGRNGMADGGEVGGQRHPYGDKVLVMLAPGEEVISNRHGQADRFRADRDAGRIPGYADGGTIRGYASGGSIRQDPVAATLWQSGHRVPDASLIANMWVPQIQRLGRAFDDLSSRRLTRLGRALEKATSLQEKQTEKARTRFEAVRDRRNEFGSSITDGLRGDLFADNSGSAFGKQFASGSIGAVNAQLREERDRAKQFSRDIATLRKKGVNGAALEEIIASGDADRARMFASGSTSALRSYEAAFNARQSATAAAGRLGGQVLTPEFNSLRHAYNQQLAQMKAMNRQIALLRKEQGHRHDAAQKSRKDNGAGSAAKKGASGRR